MAYRQEGHPMRIKLTCVFVDDQRAEYDRLIAEARETSDTAKRYELYQRCEQILVEECPLAPVYFYARNNLRRPEVKGWYGNLLDHHSLKGVYLDTAAAR